MSSLDGKVIIVTGASRGHRRGRCLGLWPTAGATVVLTARDGKLADEVARSIGGSASAQRLRRFGLCRFRSAGRRDEIAGSGGWTR